MLNALLIQLFGREVIESLAHAGFDGPEPLSRGQGGPNTRTLTEPGWPRRGPLIT